MWTERYTDLQINWDKTYDRFRHHFCGTQRDADLLAEIYGQIQRKESVELLVLAVDLAVYGASPSVPMKRRRYEHTHAHTTTTTTVTPSTDTKDHFTDNTGITTAKGD